MNSNGVLFENYERRMEQQNPEEAADRREPDIDAINEQFFDMKNHPERYERWKADEQDDSWIRDNDTGIW